MKQLRRGIQHTVRDLLEDAAREPGRLSVEAQARGVSVTELLAAEITAAVGMLLPDAETPWAGN